MTKTAVPYKFRNRLIFKIEETTYINWPLVECMKHLNAETLEEALITSRNDVNFLARRNGAIPKEILLILKRN